jgi:hypothetical protein
MMREIGTMAIWIRHLLSHCCPGAILFGVSLALSGWKVHQTRKLRIIAQNTNPAQQRTITILAFLERWWQ